MKFYIFVRASILSGIPSHQNGQFGLHNGYHHFNSFEGVKSVSNILSENDVFTGLCGKKNIGSNMTYRESLSAKIGELKGINDIKRKMQGQLKEIGYSIDTLENEKRSLLKVMHKDYHSVKDVRDGINELEYK